MSVILNIRDLNITFRTDGGIVNAVRNVNLQIERGTTMGIVGESGCGKSTVLRAVTGLLPPNATVTAGALQLDGDDLAQLLQMQPRSVRGRRIATVFQDGSAALNPYLTIGRQLTETVCAHFTISEAGARAKAVEMLTKVAIPDPRQTFYKYPHELSGGQRQRVVIAAALMADPAIILADEPTTALDPTIQLQILELLRTLQKEHDLTILFISHDLRLVAAISHRVAVMYAGRIVEEGSAAELYHRPAHPYTRALLASAAPLDGARPRRLRSIEGAPPPPGSTHTGCAFAPRCEFAADICKVETPAERILNSRRVACVRPLEEL